MHAPTLTALILTTGLAFATEFHVAPTGLDTSPGTAAAPWRTLTHAAGHIAPGDTVIVHTGTYTERLVPPLSGTSGAYISFRAAPGETPVIDGASLTASDFSGLVDLSNRSFIRIEGFTITHNILLHSITKGGHYNTFIVQWNTTGTDTTIHHNLHFGPNTPVWVLKDNWTEGWTAYLADSNSGSNELWGDPGFANPAADNFLPATAGPAIDNADPAVLTPGERDFPGNLRNHGPAPDRGAIEHDAPAPPRPKLVPTLDATGLRIDGTVAPGLFHELQQSTNLQTWQSIPGHDSLPADTPPLLYQSPATFKPGMLFRAQTH